MKLSDLTARFSRREPASADPARAYGSEAEIAAELQRQAQAQAQAQRPSRSASERLASLQEREWVERPARRNTAPTYSADTYGQEAAPDLGWENAFSDAPASAPSASERYEAFRSAVYSSPAPRRQAPLHYDYSYLYAQEQPPAYPPQGYAPDPAPRGGAAYRDPYASAAPIYEELQYAAPAPIYEELNYTPPAPVYEEVNYAPAAPVYEDLSAGRPAAPLPQARADFQELSFAPSRAGGNQRSQAFDAAAPSSPSPGSPEPPLSASDDLYRRDPEAGAAQAPGGELRFDVPRPEGRPETAQFVSNAPRRRSPRDGDLRYYFWSGSILLGAALTVFSFIYACVS